MVVQGASQVQKINILYQMMAMKENEGDPPQVVLEMLEKTLVM